MDHRWAQLQLALGLVACVLFAPRASGQSSHQHAAAAHRRGSLRQNEPNPFSGQTTIPFTVGDAECAAGTQSHVVTVRIYNILSQVVAFPVLADSTPMADSTTAATTSPPPPRHITNLALPCGAYVARWDGTRASEGRNAPAGVYMYQLLIDGHPAGMRKMVLTR